MARRGVICLGTILAGLIGLAFLLVASGSIPVRADGLTISNISTSTNPTSDGGTGVDVTVSFSTSEPATATVSLNNQNIPSAPPIWQQQPNSLTQHTITFPHISSSGQYNVRIEARTANGQTAIDNSHTITVVVTGGQQIPPPAQAPNANAGSPISQQSCTFNCDPNTTNTTNGLPANQSSVVFPSTDPSANQGSLKITNFKVTILDDQTAEVSFDQSSPASGVVFAQSVASQSTVATYTQSNTAHQDVTFCLLEKNATYRFAAGAADQQNSVQNHALYVDPKTYHLTGAGSGQTYHCASLGNNVTVPVQNQLAGQSSYSGPFGQILYNLFGNPWFLIGGRTLTGADILWWSYLFLLGVTTLLVVYFIGKRRRLWGVVYDARSKQPIELAVVRLFDENSHKLLETRVTNHSGRYSFLAEPGEFYLEVTKDGYHFPSRIITQKIDNEYTNLYRGEVIKLGAGQSLIAPDVPVDSQDGTVVRASFFRRIIFPVLDKIRLPLILLALIIDLLVGATTHLGLGRVFALKQFLIAGPVVLLAIEFLMIRRNNRR